MSVKSAKIYYALAKYGLIHFLFGIICIYAQGQTLERKVFSTAGITGAPTGAYFSITIGEAVMGTRFGTSPFLIQGFQQPIVLRPLAAVGSNLTGYWQENQVMLNWATHMPANEGHFIIERSFEANTFQAIGLLASSGGLTYSFEDTDEQLKNQENIYYRIKHVQLNGEYVYSNTIEINPDAAFNVNVFPNPVQNSFTIVGLSNKPYNIQLLNSIGQKVLSGVYEDSNQISLDVGHLAKGTYILRISSTDTYVTHRIFLR